MVFDLNRRDFIKVGVASVATLSQLRADRSLTDQERATLRAMAKTMFPHVGATREFYDQAVDYVQSVCHRDPNLFAVVTSGVSVLEWSCGGRFAVGSEVDRIRMLKDMESSRFFHFVYGCSLESLYRSQMIWSILGVPTSQI